MIDLQYVGEQNLNIDSIDVFIFDFDGVLTNNLVHVDGNGLESVSCNRGDGLGFDLLRKIKKSVYILSTEKNGVVSARANKLKVPVIQGVSNKSEVLKKMSIEYKFSLDRAMYIGNDLNDYYAIKICKYSACPADSHKKIKKISTFVLNANGGEGVLRELLEEKLKVNLLDILYR
jgi:3-deoxy-D-manno-octulosonate 8-phosphate phosphatase (KDO 8-P phosphatase)